MARKTHFGSFGPNLAPKFFFIGITSTMISIQFPGKLMIKTQQNDKTPYFGPDLEWLSPNLGYKIFVSKIWFRQSLDIIVSYHQ